MPRVLGQLVGIVRVTEVLDGVVQHDVQEGIKPLQGPAGLSASGKLDSDLLVDKPEEETDFSSMINCIDLPAQIEDGLFLLSLPSVTGLIRRRHDLP